jgi:rhodanese-related sulfurtransferase
VRLPERGAKGCGYRHVCSTPSWDDDRVRLLKQVKPAVHDEPHPSCRAHLAFVYPRNCEPVPAPSHLRPGQPEDLDGNAELERTQPVVGERDDELRLTALSSADQDFVLLHVVGSPEAYARRHVPGAIHLPHKEITSERMRQWPDGTLFVAYCAGPHCNGADQAALKLARLRLPVKIMIGGITGWADEGLLFASGSDPGAFREAAE